MSFESQLIHTCVVERDPTNGEDLHGNAPVGQDPQLIYAGMCRLVERNQRVLTEHSGYTLVKVLTLLVPPDTEILGRDRVKSVTLEDGTTLTNAFMIKGVTNRRGKQLHHQSLDLERIS
jgi:hypothetical protein